MRNDEKLTWFLKENKQPVIFYNVETTGCMDGNDNRVTQIAIASYDFNLSSGKYELQDHMFMLAKASGASLKNIEERQAVSDENVRKLLEEDFVYDYTEKEKRDIRNCENRMKTLQNRIDNPKNDVQLEKARESMTKELDLLEQLRTALIVKETYLSNHKEDLLNGEEFETYYEEHYELKKKALEDAPSLKEVLSMQGIALDNWRKSNDGLSYGEMQIGINKFLEKYQKNNTVFVSNGSYFANHYLKKEKMSVNIGKEEIDLPKALGEQEWTQSIDKIKIDYKTRTGKEIKCLDALTKCLCMAETIQQYKGISFVNNSKKYLEEQVKLETIRGREGDYEEGDYVVTQAQLSRANICLDIPSYNINIPTFNSLEYINFGSERRYVDIDRMFEVNDNFEITLEGEKEPIRTWEELEEKIKALNGEISPELLNRIHEKYDEMVKKNVDNLLTASLEAEVEEDIEVVENPVSSTSQMLQNLFNKNKELDAIVETKNELQDKLHKLNVENYARRFDKVFCDLKQLDNIFKSINVKEYTLFKENDCKICYYPHRHILDDGPNIKYISLNECRNTIQSHDMLSCNGTEEETKLFVNEIYNKWDTIYADVLEYLSKKLDSAINTEKTCVQSIQEEIDGFDMDEL